MGYAGICYSCQNGILKQALQNVIVCPSCNTEWKNNHVRGSLPKKSQGMGCFQCGGGILLQSYPNVIYCGSCATKWTAYRLKGYSKKAHEKYELKRGW